jgi:DNA repair exonuclease SbcCD ATPase subunit
MDERARL